MCNSFHTVWARSRLLDYIETYFYMCHTKSEPLHFILLTPSDFVVVVNYQYYG
jgi:hypothetical protein